MNIVPISTKEINYLTFQNRFILFLFPIKCMISCDNLICIYFFPDSFSRLRQNFYTRTFETFTWSFCIIILCIQVFILYFLLSQYTSKIRYITLSIEGKRCHKIKSSSIVNNHLKPYTVTIFSFLDLLTFYL